MKFKLWPNVKEFPPLYSVLSRLLDTNWIEAKRCRLDGRVFLHLVYSRRGSEFSVYLRPSDDRQLSGEIAATESGKRIYRADSGEHHIAYFQTHQLTALFVTDEPSAVALSLADSAARLL